MLTSCPEGRTGFIEADLNEPDTIVGAPELRAVLDLRRPVALLLVAVLHFLPDDDMAGGAVKRLVAELPAGSYVVVSHATGELLSDQDRARVQALSAAGGHGPFRMRSRDQIAGFVEGLELVEPGLVPVQRWRPPPGSEVRADEQVGMYAVVAHKRP